MLGAIAESASMCPMELPSTRRTTDLAPRRAASEDSRDRELKEKVEALSSMKDWRVKIPIDV